VLNEILDAPGDATHPRKRVRPVPAGQVSVTLAYAQWLGLLLLGVVFGVAISLPFALCMLVLWLLGGVYNVPPLRAKDVPYVDVLVESLNNPIRLTAGWLIVAPLATLIPLSLLLSYWMVGAYFMAIKRFAEYRSLSSALATRYRPALATYSEPRLLISVTFYASAAMLFLGAFIMRYRLELMLTFPLVATVMAVYFALAFKPDSAAQAPEKLYREPTLFAAVLLCAAAMTALMLVDLPVLYEIFVPTLPTPSP
jgi:4-hydroxybenzoate polyprenyltransferase